MYFGDERSLCVWDSNPHPTSFLAAHLLAYHTRISPSVNDLQNPSIDSEV